MPLTAEQLANRKIGGSDVGTILGLNPYKTPLELYGEMIGSIERVDLSENENVEAGSVLEDGIAELTARRLSKRDGREIKLRRSNITIVNPKYPWLTAHIDRDIVGESRGVEIKNVGWRAARNWGEEGTDQIPDYYICQPHTYMICKSYPKWVVSAYFGGSEIRLYDVDYSAEMAELIIERTKAFWDAVQNHTPPEFDPGHPHAAEAIRRLYPGTNGESLAATPGHYNWLEVLQEANRLKLQYEKSAELAKAHLLYYMGEAAELTFNNGTKITRRLVKRKGYTVEDTSYMDVRIKAQKED